MLFGNIIELRLRAFHVSLAGPSAGADGNFRLLDLVAVIHDIHGLPRQLRQIRVDALALIVLQDEEIDGGHAGHGCDGNRHDHPPPQARKEDQYTTRCEQSERRAEIRLSEYQCRRKRNQRQGWQVNEKPAGKIVPTFVIVGG